MIPFLPFPLPALAVLITGGTLEKAAAMANHASTRRCQSNGGSPTCSATAISRAAIYAARARHSAKAKERLSL